MIERLVDQIEVRFADASRTMSDPAIFEDRNRAAAAGRAYRQLEPAAKLAEEWRRAKDDEAGAREMLAEGEDAEVREMLAAARARLVVHRAPPFLGQLRRGLELAIGPTSRSRPVAILEDGGVGHGARGVGEAHFDLVDEPLDHGIEGSAGHVQSADDVG